MKNKKSSKGKTRKIKSIYFFIILSIIVIISLFFFIKNRVKYEVSNEHFNEYNKGCEGNIICENCSVLISCASLVDSEQGHYLFFKIKNQNNKQGDCFVEFSISDIERILVNQTYKIGKITPNESKAYKIPFNVHIENFTFKLTPICKWK